MLGHAEPWPKAALLCSSRGKAAPQPWAQGLEDKVGHVPPGAMQKHPHFQRGCGSNQALALLLVNPLAAPCVLMYLRSLVLLCISVISCL